MDTNPPPLSDLVRGALAVAFLLVALAPLSRRPLRRMSVGEVAAVFLIADLGASLLAGRPLRSFDFLLSAIASLFLYYRREARARTALSGKPETRPLRPEP